MKKSYWQTMSVRTERDKEACLSWFAPLCKGMTVESARILCDVATDREKKIQIVGVHPDGRRERVTRTRGKRETMIKFERLSPVAHETMPGVERSEPAPI